MWLCYLLFDILLIALIPLVCSVLSCITPEPCEDIGPYPRGTLKEKSDFMTVHGRNEQVRLGRTWPKAVFLLNI